MSEATTLALHRCRFVDLSPSPITALAFPPLSLPSPNKKPSSFGKQPLRFGTLAVGHANGNIDLCEWTGAEGDIQSSQAWAIRTVIFASMLHVRVVLKVTLRLWLDHIRLKSIPSPLQFAIRTMCLRTLFLHALSFGCSLLAEAANY